ncbi:hypothetical protein ACJX0J_019570, partial [Zea mays]
MNQPEEFALPSLHGLKQIPKHDYVADINGIKGKRPIEVLSDNWFTHVLSGYALFECHNEIWTSLDVATIGHYQMESISLGLTGHIFFTESKYFMHAIMLSIMLSEFYVGLYNIMLAIHFLQVNETIFESYKEEIEDLLTNIDVQLIITSLVGYYNLVFIFIFYKLAIDICDTKKLTDWTTLT